VQSGWPCRRKSLSKHQGLLLIPRTTVSMRALRMPIGAFVVAL